VTVAVLANPSAGKGRRRGLLPDLVERLGRSGRRIRLLAAATAQEARTACVAAVGDGADVLVAIGGDGTVHLALQAVAGTDVALGIVPLGTGNDFADAVGIPRDPGAAVDSLVAALREERGRRVDLARMTAPGRATPVWFGAVLACGFDAIVNERANRMRWPRGDVRYDLAILAELARLRPRAYTLRLDGVPYELPAVLLAVGNTASYGGGMRICPAADPTDGLLDVVLAAPISRMTVVRIKPRLYAGTHVNHPAVSAYRASTVEIAAAGITTYADGERALPLPVTVVSQPGALRLLSPG
jgi:diacylglycerol kinase (ATP)